MADYTLTLSKIQERGFNRYFCAATQLNVDNVIGNRFYFYLPTGFGDCYIERATLINDQVGTLAGYAGGVTTGGQLFVAEIGSGATVEDIAAPQFVNNINNNNVLATTWEPIRPILWRTTQYVLLTSGLLYDSNVGDTQDVSGQFILSMERNSVYTRPG